MIIEARHPTLPPNRDTFPNTRITRLDLELPNDRILKRAYLDDRELLSIELSLAVYTALYEHSMANVSFAFTRTEYLDPGFKDALILQYLRSSSYLFRESNRILSLPAAGELVNPALNTVAPQRNEARFNTWEEMTANWGDTTVAYGAGGGGNGEATGIDIGHGMGFNTGDINGEIFLAQ